MRKPTLFTFFLLLITISVFANHQQGAIPNYKIRRISPNGGLSSNGQRDVKQDRWGFIWVVTVSDLYRFDGYNFKYYTDKLPKSDYAVNWTFERLEIDTEGDIYLTTNNGLMKYNPLTDNFERIFQGRITLLKEDAKGRLWMSDSYSIGLFDKHNFQLAAIASEEGSIQGVSTICTQEQSVYIGTSTGHIYAYDENRKKFQPVFSDPTYTIVDIIRTDSLLYVLTENKGLRVISFPDYREIKQYDFFYPQGDRRVPARALFIDKLGHIWITGQRGIYILDPTTDGYAHYAYDKMDPYSLPSSSVWRISEDKEGGLWFGTYSGGLCYVNLHERRSLRTFNGLTDELSYSVVSCFEEDDRSLWIGTEGGGLNRLDKQNNTFTCFKHRAGQNSLSYDNIQALLFTGDNKLWIGMSRGGMDCLDTRTGRFTHYGVSNNMLKNDHVERIVAEADSGIWIKYLMDRDHLSYLSTKDFKIEHYNFRTAPIGADGDISDIQRGNGDTLWIVSASQLLIMNVRTRNVSFAGYNYSETNHIQQINIRAIWNDRINHQVWVGTVGNGLWVYDVSTQELSLKADLSKYDVHTLYSLNGDQQGNVWMGTNNGLFRLDTKTNRLQQFDKADGAQGKMYYPHATYRSASGELFFGGNEGFTVVDPTLNSYNGLQPQVIVSEFYLDNVPVIPGVKDSPLKASIFQTTELVLDYNQNNFSFEFTSTNYQNPDKNRFRCRLKGYDDRWIETSANQRSASYAKVPRGKYSFEIMTANNDGLWGPPTIVQLTVKPAPWYSVWAIMGYILLLSAVLYMILTYYTYQRSLKMQFYLEEQEKKQKEEYHQEQLKFFTNVSHDFRTPLSLIIAAIDAIKSGNITGKYITTLDNNARRLISLINELMDFRTLQNRKVKLSLQEGDLNAFVTESCADFMEYAQLKQILFKVETDPQLPASLCYDQKVMEKILLNLLNNAFKYTSPGGQITVMTVADISNFRSAYTKCYMAKQAENKERLFGLVISDNGVGISENSIAHIFERYYRVNESGGTPHLGSGIGLALVKSLVELHKSTIAVYSERGRGTDILVGFPADPSVYDTADRVDTQSNSVLSDTQPFFESAKNAGNEEKVREEDLLSTKKTILIVEDNDELREYLADMLHGQYDIKEVANGREALTVIDEEDIDLVLTDVMMPYISGIELSKILKEQMETSHIPIVMLTAKTGIENQIEGLYSGADVYLEKPVNKQVLALNLANLFKQQQRIRDYYAKYYFAQPESNETLINRRDAAFMDQFIGVIEENLTNVDIDVLQIAASLAMSRRKLYGKVKALTGQSVVEYIRNYRLRKAAQLLVGEDIPISDVMERVGIDNASYFSRIFKKEFGESPSDFAAKHRKQ